MFEARRNLQRSDTPVTNDTTITPFRQLGSIIDPLSEIARDWARRILMAALKAEANGFVAQISEDRLASTPKRRRNGRFPFSASPDSTGIKFLGDGEWQARKHGVQGRRQWRKDHLAMDTTTSDIRAVELPPAAMATVPFCRSCSTRYPTTKRSAP